MRFIVGLGKAFAQMMRWLFTLILGLGALCGAIVSILSLAHMMGLL